MEYVHLRKAEIILDTGPMRGAYAITKVTITGVLTHVLSEFLRNPEIQLINTAIIKNQIYNKFTIK